MLKNKKILLIIPSTFADDKKGLPAYLPTFAGLIEPAPPLGIMALAAYLKREMRELNIRVLDGNILDFNVVLKTIKEFRPHVVGISCSFMNYENALVCAKMSKSIGAKVILGGPYASVAAQVILRNRGPGSKDYCIDVVCRQDGEEAIKQFIQGVAYKKIPNLAWREGGCFRFNKIENMDQNDLPFLNFDGFGLSDISDYYKLQFLAKKNRNKIFRHKLFSLLSSKGIYAYSRKGCFWRSLPGRGCIFCSAVYSDILLKSPERFLEEIIFLKEKYKPDVIYDVSEDFLGNVQWFEKFCRLAFKQRSLPKFVIYTRLDRINEKTAVLLKKCNVVAVSAGFESGSDKILNFMRKGLSLNDCLRGANLLSGCGIGLFTNFIFGGPGETKETLDASLGLISMLRRNNHLILPRYSRFSVLIGSPAFELLLKKKRRKYSNLDYFNQEEALCDWLKYFTKVNLSDISAAIEKAKKIIFPL